MTKRKLKGYVKPTIFMVSITTIIISLLVINTNMETSNTGSYYVMNAIIDNVVPTNATNTREIIRPYTTDSVTEEIGYYEKDGTETDQQNSLIYYENTYIQNSGIVYSSSEEFDVVAPLDGTVIDIKEDEILNTVVYIAHENNITTIYYGLKDVNLKINDQISQNSIIGKSTSNKFSNNNYSLLFEVNDNGQVINPNNFYSMNFNE
jgi:murein DD-endopeptidase MepM/ murein hydrolase activator NlpD